MVACHLLGSQSTVLSFNMSPQHLNAFVRDFEPNITMVTCILKYEHLHISRQRRPDLEVFIARNLITPTNSCSKHPPGREVQGFPLSGAFHPLRTLLPYSTLSAKSFCEINCFHLSCSHATEGTSDRPVIVSDAFQERGCKRHRNSTAKHVGAFNNKYLPGLQAK